MVQWGGGGCAKPALHAASLISADTGPISHKVLFSEMNTTSVTVGLTSLDLQHIIVDSTPIVIPRLLKLIKRLSSQKCCIVLTF